MLDVVEEENKSVFASGGQIVKKKYNTVNSLFQNKNFHCRRYVVFFSFFPD